MTQAECVVDINDDSWNMQKNDQTKGFGSKWQAFLLVAKEKSTDKKMLTTCLPREVELHRAASHQNPAPTEETT